MIVNKTLLKDIFKPNPSAECIKEVRKVIHIVLCRHFSNYLNDPDLIQLAYYELLKRSDKYDEQYDAYNYIYTVCRDQIGNFLKRNHETPVEDFVSIHEDIIDSDYDEIPPIVQRFKAELLGTEDFNFKRVAKKDAFALLVWLRLHTKPKVQKSLLDLSTFDKTQLQLYRLSQDLFDILIDDNYESDK